MRTCTKCNETKSLDEFSPDKRNKAGLQSICKVCRAAHRRAYLEVSANKEKVLAKQRAHRKANRAFHSARERAWREANPEKYKAQQRAYYEANREEILVKARAHRKTENGYWSKRRSTWRELGILDIDTLDWAAFVEAQNYECYVCGTSIDIKTALRDHDHETGLTRAAVCGTKCNTVMDLVARGVIRRANG